MFGIGALPGIALAIQSIVAMPESDAWLRKKV